MYRTLIACLFACLLVVFVSGCGGGSGDPAANQTTSASTAENYIEIAAIPGPIVAVRVGEVVVLDDSRSFALSTEALSYHWSFSYKPNGSNAKLQDATSATPSFIADVRGSYMVQLVVSAEGVSSQRAITSIVATIPPESFTGPFHHQGLSSNCVNCHNDDFSTIQSKSLTHIATSNTCQSCHTPQGFNNIPFADHQEVFGNCSQCHNGDLAIGKSEFHMPTDAECNECHNTTHFLQLEPDGSFDHTNITRGCTGCHNGAVATGKTPTILEGGTHPDTGSECGYCHTTASFLGAYPDHTGPEVVGAGITCDSCHVANGSGPALGQSLGHPVTNVDCATCHSIVSFKMPGGVFNHSLVDPTVQSCESCHNDNTSINAPAKSSAVPTHPATTADCGSCHNTESFTPAFGVDHTGIVSGCGDSCHVADGSGSASGMPLSTPFYAHMPTPEDCSACHTPGTFSTGTYDHAGINNGCNSCHDGRISVAKLLNHIPTNPDNQDCAVCHNTTDFAAAIFDHVGIDSSNCALCHDGDISPGKPVNHLPTSLDCSSCHITNNFVSFAGIAFNHLGIDNNNCASCHDTGIATPKIVNHIPAQDDCSVCHDSTSVFTSTMFLTSVHQDITSGCEGCHSGQFSTISGMLYGKPGNHLPTLQDCDVCHTVAAFTPTIFAHTGISGNCVSCHDGTHDNDGTGAIGMTPDHPATSGQDCGVCHGIGASFAGAKFNHQGIVNNCASCHGDGGTATPKSNGHVPTTQDCSVCHVPGSFSTAVFNHTGIVDNCASCHAGSGAIATVKNNGHLPTTEDCSVCHITTAFAGAKFDHQGIVDNCSSCHNSITARGKAPPPDHVPTSDDCNVCHVTTGFVPATFDHAGIVDNCSSCHNNVFAIGKAVGHVLTNQDCGVCHTTGSFIGAGFDHTGIVDNCSSCHGVTATGMHNDHVATALDCHFCHTTATFVGGTWTHDASSAGRCDDCHNNNGGGASFKPQGHLSTNVQCDVCHSTNGWAPDIFKHDPQGDYPGDHRRKPGCSACHGNSVTSSIPYPFAQYAPFCAACHANDFESEGDHIGGKSGTVEQNKNCGSSGCHRVTSSGF